jgi:gluconate 2-dehydrogenase gamma chain
MAFTRRTLLVGGAVAGATAGLTACWRARSPHPAWEFFTEAEARTLTAFCDQIIPADEFPAASEAGVLLYIDRQLIRHYAKHQDEYRDGLAQAEELSQNRFGMDFARLNAQQQLDIVMAIEHGSPDFFELVRNHTMQGYYGSPRHGGNRDAVSWHMLGIDEPPVRGRAQYDLTAGEKR